MAHSVLPLFKVFRKYLPKLRRKRQLSAPSKVLDGGKELSRSPGRGWGRHKLSRDTVAKVYLRVAVFFRILAKIQVAPKEIVNVGRALLAPAPFEHSQPGTPSNLQPLSSLGSFGHAWPSCCVDFNDAVPLKRVLPHPSTYFEVVRILDGCRALTSLPVHSSSTRGVFESTTVRFGHSAPKSRIQKAAL